jgi:hypothetical protein
MPRCREILVMGPESYTGTDMNRWQLTVAMLRSSFSKTSPMVKNADEAACEGTRGSFSAVLVEIARDPKLQFVSPPLTGPYS